MGFTRGYRLDVTEPEFQAIWPQLVEDGRRIVEAVAARGVSLRGGHGSGEPVLTSQRTELDWPWEGVRVYERGVIYLNGDQELDEDAETFILVPLGEMAEVLSSGWYCKTEGAPYDVAVSAILLRAAALAPEHVVIGTGDADDWESGRVLLSELGLEAGDADVPDRT